MNYTYQIHPLVEKDFEEGISGMKKNRSLILKNTLAKNTGSKFL
jgi:hypothetical protein